MDFEWDEAKRELNLAKHGLDFSDAPNMFELPMLSALDTRHDYGEERWLGIGLLQGRVVVVIFTQPNTKTIRIISLRKAVSRERKRFAEAVEDRLG